MNRILKCNDHFWRADVCWRNSIAEADQQQCVFLLQQHAWKILNAHLNGGLGNGWWQYPLVVTTSSITRQMAMSLVGSWKTFAETFSFDSPYKGVDRNISVESILAIHYQNIEEFFAPKDFGDTNTIKQVPRGFEFSSVLRRFDKSIVNLKPYLLSYWVHGSVGSGDDKTDWSDLDGLAIVRSDTLRSPRKIEKLRKGLIDSRRYMTDFLPFQLHGHFVIAEQDLLSYPSSMFPITLFADAQCILASSDCFHVNEMFDKRFALEMLWYHGIRDLSKASPIPDKGVTGQIAFLHRLYLLPCLVMQVYDNPNFKRAAFKDLDNYFTNEEVQFLIEASEVWENWTPPNITTRIAARLPYLVRFNPVLYQKLSLRIGAKLPWLMNAPQIDWFEFSVRAKSMSERVWRDAILQALQ